MVIASAIYVDPNIENIGRLCNGLFKWQYLGNPNKVILNINMDFTFTRPRFYDLPSINDMHVPSSPIMIVEDFNSSPDKGPTFKRNLDFLNVFYAYQTFG